jgi:hypothetical protein
MTQALLDSTRPASSSRIIAYETAQVVPGIINDTFFLIVSGGAPCFNMDVALSPLIYVTCPEHWGIEVVGTLKGGFCLTAVKPFSVAIPLAGIIGSKGIEVIGSNKSESFDLPGGCT